ncbi:MAG TPA: hypothetical protein VMH02_03360, partial [Verrucomicrobiae bacterium]|nr:hypothetical protein [Verrucomicrobiae bacterium]
AVMAAVAIAGCSGGSSANSADNTAAANAAADNDAATNAATNTAATGGGGTMTAASTEPGAPAAIPNYPNATAEASGSSSMGANGGTASGKVLATTDSFEKVYAWYQKEMPAGSERSHITTPMKSAVFMVGNAGEDQESVTITTSPSGNKTLITIARVKM